MALVWKRIAFVEDVAAQSVMGNPTGSPAVASAITVAEQTLVGRITGGNVDDLSVDQVKTMLGITVSGSSIAVHQDGHGFAVGDELYLDSTVYKKADCTTEATAEVAGKVSAVAGADDFTLTTSGWMDGLTGLTAGAVYFLSSTAGAMTVTAPTTEGYIDKPVFLADTTTSGFVLQMRGVVITASAVSDTAYGTSWNGVTDVAPSKNAVYDKIEALSAGFPSGTKMLFYQDTAPTGWTIENTLDDKLVYITKGSAAGGQTGGAAHSTGTWTQPNHNHTLSAHVHSMMDHTHTVSVVNTSTTPGGAYGIVAAQQQTTSGPSHANTDAPDKDYTSDSATANTWRPAAYNCIICSKN
jgi:hypothetical protein